MVTQACPIDSVRVNERVSRATALVVLLLLAVFYFTRSFWLIVLLMADFFLRAFGKMKRSPVSALCAYILGKMKVPAKLVNAAPKVFAARIGFSFCFCIALCSAVSLYWAATVLTALLAVCTFLEAAFGFCIGCRLYVLLHALARKDAAGMSGGGEQVK